MLYAIVGLLFLVADQFLKFWTVSHIELNADPGKVLIPGLVNLTHIKNFGAAFGLFSDKPMLRWILLVLLVLFTLFIVLGLAKGFLRTGLARWSGTLLLAGLLGNGVDRAIYGYVVDMIEPHLGSFRLPIFNLADCLIVVFGILFCISLLRGGIGAPYEDDDYDEDEDEMPRRGRRSRTDDDEEDEEEEIKPRRGRRARRDEEDEDEEEVRPQRVRRPAAETAEPVQPRRVRTEAAEEAPVRPRRVTEAEVAEKVRAARAESRPSAVQEAARAVAAAEKEAPAAEARVRQATAESQAAVRTVARPAPVQAAPAPRAPQPAEVKAPAVETKAQPAEDEFDLDSILAEFK